MDAVNSELNSLASMGTWVECNPKAQGLNVSKIPTHAVSKIKRNGMGEAVRFQARVVVNGNMQVYQKDYDKTYAPVCDFSTTRAAMTSKLFNGWLNRHIDIKTANRS